MKREVDGEGSDVKLLCCKTHVHYIVICLCDLFESVLSVKNL